MSIQRAGLVVPGETHQGKLILPPGYEQKPRQNHPRTEWFLFSLGYRKPTTPCPCCSGMGWLGLYHFPYYGRTVCPVCHGQRLL